MKIKKVILGLISLLVFSTPHCSDYNYHEAESIEQVGTLPLNDIAFKVLDKKASQPFLRQIGQQHSYTNYRYIVIGDVRPRVDKHEINLVNPIFISLLDSIAMLKPQPDFVMVLGDLVWSGSEIEYRSYYDLIKNWMEATDIAVFAVPGNHEFIEPGAFELYEKFIGALDYCFDWKTSTFIVLNNVQRPDNPHYEIEDFQLNFLSSVLKTAQSLKFVCTHVPYDGIWDMPLGYVEFLDILAEHNVTVSWEAHSHYFMRYWVNNVLHIITGGGGAELFDLKVEDPPLFFSTKHHFLVVDVRRDRIEIKVFFYKEGYSSKDYNIILEITR